MRKSPLCRMFLTFFLLLMGISGATYGQNNYKERLTEGWEFTKGDLGGIWEALRTGREANLPVWEKVALPHSYNAFDAVDPDKPYYQGAAWYRTTLDINNPFPSGRTLLHFEGAGQKTSIYVYDMLVGEHIGGYDEFTIDITDAIKKYIEKKKDDKQDNKIPVSIRVDNTRDLEMIPSDLSDFNLYGGLYRYVNLVYVPAISIDKLHITTVLSEELQTAEVSVDLDFYNPDMMNTGLQINLQILSPDGREIFRQEKNINTSSSTNSKFTFQIQNPELWSPENPQLYHCKVSSHSSAGNHAASSKFGLRSFEFIKKGPFHLNGERLLLRGTHRHEDHAGTGPAMTEEMIRKEIRMMKDMGVNFIRLGHYQQSRIVLEACDEMGILVWEEIPWCRGGLGGEIYKQQARRMLTNMIQQHYNHPSVIIWGLGNENDWPGDFEVFDKEKIRSFMSELNDLSHKLDPSRKTAIRRCDFCKDIVDVYSPSIWAGWYRGKYTDYREVSRQNMEEVDHYLHVEWGASHHALRHSENPDIGLGNISSGEADERAGDFLMKGGEPRVSRDGDWTESYAVNLIDWHLKEQEKMDWLTGTAYWPFKDFSTPLRPENPVPYVNQKGVVQRDFTKKESFYVFQSYWTEKPMVHIYGHTFTTRWDKEKDGNLVKIYSNCPKVELFLNGKSLGIKERDSQNFPAAGLRWHVFFEEGENELRAIALKGEKSVEDRINVNFQNQDWNEPAQMLLEVTQMENDTATIRVLALDENGVLCLDATNFVRFGLTGDGELIDNLGTSTGARKVQLYNGRATINVKMNGGTSRASVSSSSIPTAFCTISEQKESPESCLRPVPLLQANFGKKDVLQNMKKVADWQLENMPVPGDHPRHYYHWDWTNASLYTGIMALYRTSGSKKYFKTLENFADQIDWGLGPRFRHADDICIGQTYLELYEIKPADYKIEKVKARIDSLMADPKPGRVDWWWCDALYMAPPVLARLAKITGEKDYLDYMNKMWWDATDFLYDPDEKLFYRDDRFRIKEDGSGRREDNGKKVFWSRGNGWVMGGTARVLDYMPEDYPDRTRYEDLFKKMAAKIACLQQEDGSWKSSLLHPENHAHGETSGTGFYCYAIAWGINEGLLEKELYFPVVLRAWDFLNKAVQPNGKLVWVQQIGSAPDEIHKNMTEVYGIGAYLLAGSELYKLVK